MKRIILFVLLTLAGTAVFAQQAQDYFPQQTGYRWNYKVIPLDSMNNDIDSLTYYRVDSFAVATNFMGRSADLLVSKNGTYNLINYMPYTDSSFFSFENADGYQYFRISNLGSLVTVLDSIGLDSTLLGVIQSFEDWYSVFRFSQSVNSEYTIFSKDTTLNLGGTNAPLRFKYLGKRLDDENIQTEAGSFTCKKFLLSPTVVSCLDDSRLNLSDSKQRTGLPRISAGSGADPFPNYPFDTFDIGKFCSSWFRTELIPLITSAGNPRAGTGI